MTLEEHKLDPKVEAWQDACEPYSVYELKAKLKSPELTKLRLQARIEVAAEKTVDGGFTEEAIDQAAREILPTLDEASTELAAKLGERYEQRLTMRQRMLEGLSPRGRFRRNAPCPCGSGKKFKKCHRRDFLDKKNGRRDPTPDTSDKETPDDANSDQS